MNTIRVVHNHAGNCINFYNSTQPVYWNGCLNASVSAGTTDRIDIENTIRDVGTGSSIYEFFRVPHAIFVDKDNVGFASAQAAVDYINDASNTINQQNRFIMSDADSIDFKIDDSFSTILLDNGDNYPTDFLKAIAVDSTSLNIATIQATDVIIYEGLSVSNVTINSVGLGTTVANVVNDLNALFTQTGGTAAPVVSSASTINVGVGNIINYEATTTGGDVSAFEWTNLPEGVTQVINHPQKIVGGSNLSAGTYNVTVRAHNYVGVATHNLSIVVGTGYVNAKSTNFADTEYVGLTRTTGQFTNLIKVTNIEMPAHSWAFWLKPGNSTRLNQNIFSAASQNDTYNGTSFIECRYLGSNARKSIRVQWSVSGIGKRLTLITPDDSITRNVWNHVVVTCGGNLTSDNHEVTVYINGVSQTLTPADNSNGIEYNSGPINPNIIQFARNPGNQYMQGNKLDEFGFWNQELSSSQVSTLYNSGTPTDLTTYTPAASHVYRFGDGDTFPTISDNVGDADMTMNNMSSSSFVDDAP